MLGMTESLAITNAMTPTQNIVQDIATMETLYAELFGNHPNFAAEWERTRKETGARASAKRKGTRPQSPVR